MSPSRRSPRTALLIALASLAGCAGPASAPLTSPGPVAFYDFEHPLPGDAGREADQGSSGTPLLLVNGGAAMRVADGAHPGSRFAIQTRQLTPGAESNDDWKAGVWSESGVPSLRAFAGVRGITVATWVKRTGTHPMRNTNTPATDDVFNAVGLAGVLTGNSSGHDVRALLEVISVNDTLRLVALGRRVDTGSSRTFAARGDWQEEHLRLDEWTHLAATFDFDDGTMALYRNGVALDGFYTSPGDAWQVEGPPEPDLASATDPRGFKIGGSFPQNTDERNPFDGRFDDLMFFDRELTPAEILALYRRHDASGGR